MSREQILDALITVNSEKEFWALAEQIFDYQVENNPLFGSFVKASAKGFPNFLPIDAFKRQDIKSGIWETETTFESSGTTATTTSKHHVRNLDFYLENSIKLFENAFGSLKQYTILALLPNYLERGNSSLVAMVNCFIDRSHKEQNGFYLYNHSELFSKLSECRRKGEKTILFGVSFALLDFIQVHQLHFPELIVIETGGMKGRGRELPRFELHDQLAKAFGVPKIYSEYGMTELFSQCYSKGDGIFEISSTMRVIVTEINDPYSIERLGKSGVINVVDLANVDTCSFISTEDIGMMIDAHHFAILGRLDNTDLRGCNLMVANDIK